MREYNEALNQASHKNSSAVTTQVIEIRRWQQDMAPRLVFLQEELLEMHWLTHGWRVDVFSEKRIRMRSVLLWSPTRTNLHVFSRGAALIWARALRGREVGADRTRLIAGVPETAAGRR